MTTTFEALVAEFHDRINFKPMSLGLAYEGIDHSHALHKVAVDYLQWYKECNDPRYLRLHLIAEEVDELTVAMVENDIVSTADALTDLLYVVIGSFVALGLPMMPLFEEVHRSNMTKYPVDSDPDKARCRDKGENYDPPQIRRILEENGVI